MYLNQHALIMLGLHTTRDSTKHGIHAYYIACYNVHCIYIYVHVYIAALNVPVYRAEMNVVVCVDLHQEASTDITVQTSNDKVRIIWHLLYTVWVL